MPKNTARKKNATNRTFMGLPVVDAKHDIKVQPNQTDLRKAKRGDPEHCAYAECLRRQWGATNVWIFKSVAYVQLLDTHGNPIIERFDVKGEAKKYRQAFDDGKPIGEAGFTLHAPLPSNTLDHITQSKRIRTAERKAGIRPPVEKRKQLITGSRLTGAAADPIELKRSGMGMVSFRRRLVNSIASRKAKNAKAKSHLGRDT